MADRLTQLQDAVNQQADNFTNSLGILQQTATPTPFHGLSSSSHSNQTGNNPSEQNNLDQQKSSNEDYTLLFTQLIARTAKDIELLIDSLPSEESSLELQTASLQNLERENAKAAKQLEDIVRQGEATLKEIQSALHDLAQSQLDIQRLAAPQSVNMDAVIGAESGLHKRNMSESSPEQKSEKDSEDFKGPYKGHFTSGIVREDEQFCEVTPPVGDRYSRWTTKNARESDTSDDDNEDDEDSEDNRGGESDDEEEEDELEEEEEEEEEISDIEEEETVRRQSTRENTAIFLAPDRAPPIRDFLTLVTAFIVAVVAAYYTISHN